MNYWLMKSEPDTFSIDDLKRRQREPWDGVRNYQARNFLRAMAVGDAVFFYHSNCTEPGIVGLARVASDAYPDPSQFNPQSPYFDPASSRAEPRWSLVDVAFERTLTRKLTLKELQAQPALAGMPLVRKGNRLSVMPVSETEWQNILALE